MRYVVSILNKSLDVMAQWFFVDSVAHAENALGSEYHCMTVHQ